MITGEREIYIQQSLANPRGYDHESYCGWQDQGLVGNPESGEPLVPLTLIQAYVFFYFKKCNSVFKNIILDTFLKYIKLLRVQVHDDEYGIDSGGGGGGGGDSSIDDYDDDCYYDSCALSYSVFTIFLCA
jgi:hypothetical protein